MANSNRKIAAAPVVRPPLGASHAGEKVSPVFTALHEVHSAHRRGHDELSRLEEALDSVLSPVPPSTDAAPRELSHSALHDELLTARDSASSFETRVISLINRLTL